jgi:ABC-type lipoprotein release transport system permease subunit
MTTASASSPWWRIGWRNLGRHPKRTAITATGLGIGYFAVVFLVGWTSGIMAEMVENATGLVSGQIEIHATEYRPERSLYDTIGGRDGADISTIIQTIASDPAVVAVAPRLYAGGMISSGESTSAGMLMGVDPLLEPELSRFLHGLVEGRPLQPGRNELLVGDELARQLAVGVGDEVVLVAPGADGSMGNDLFEVVGIFHSGLGFLDRTYGVLPLDSLQTLIVMDPGRIHEISVATADPWIAAETSARLRTTLAPLGLDIVVAPWTELRPEMVEYVALGESFYFVIIAIVFVIAMFGVANTMLMGTFERRREFAVLLALGTGPRYIVLTVLYEAAALGALSLAVGFVVTLPLMVWWHNAPPDLGWLYGEVTLMGALLRPSLRVEYDVAVWIWSALALLLTALLAAVYPAAKAARVPPADALSGL